MDNDFRNWAVWGNENPDGPNYDREKHDKKILCPYCLINEVKDEDEMCFECKMAELEIREDK
jgi:hypothetical protein